MDAIMAAWEAHPGMHVYHYAPYEPAAMKRLMGRYATREAELDRLLRAERFVDLYSIVKHSIRAERGAVFDQVTSNPSTPSSARSRSPMREPACA